MKVSNAKIIDYADMPEDVRKALVTFNYEEDFSNDSYYSVYIDPDGEKDYEIVTEYYKSLGVSHDSPDYTLLIWVCW